MAAQAATPACSSATIEPSSPAPEPARGRPPGGGSPPPQDARVTAAAPSAPRRVSVAGIGAHTRWCMPESLNRSSSLRSVRISRADWDELVAHARDEAPNECCGYLRATDGAVEAVYRASNERNSPYGYEL